MTERNIQNQGHWTVDIDPLVPNMVKMSFEEMDENGVDVKTVYMPACVAANFAGEIFKRTDYLHTEYVPEDECSCKCMCDEDCEACEDDD